MSRLTNLAIIVAMSVTSAAFCADGAPAPRAAGTPPEIFIDHDAIGVADIGKMAEWYHRVLGFEAAALRHIDSYDLQRLSLPGKYYLNLFQQKGSTRPTGVMDTDKQGLIAITFGTGDADSMYKWLVENDVHIIRTARNDAGKVTSMHFTDPEGNHLEIAQR